MFKKNKNTVLSPETESHPRGGKKQIADNVADTLSKPFNYGAVNKQKNTTPPEKPKKIL